MSCILSGLISKAFSRIAKRSLRLNCFKGTFFEGAAGYQASIQPQNISQRVLPILPPNYICVAKIAASALGLGQLMTFRSAYQKRFVTSKQQLARQALVDNRVSIQVSFSAPSLGTETQPDLRPKEVDYVYNRRILPLRFP